MRATGAVKMRAPHYSTNGAFCARGSVKITSTMGSVIRGKRYDAMVKCARRFIARAQSAQYAAALSG